ELVPLRVVVEVGEEVVAGDPAAVLPRDPEAGEAREKARRVQPQPVVALPPRGAGLGARLEDDRLEPLLPEEGCGRETGGSAADDRDAHDLHGCVHSIGRISRVASDVDWTCA